MVYGAVNKTEKGSGVTNLIYALSYALKCKCLHLEFSMDLIMHYILYDLLLLLLLFLHSPLSDCCNKQLPGIGQTLTSTNSRKQTLFLKSVGGLQSGLIKLTHISRPHF